MLTVSELASESEVTPDTVRHYAHIGLLSPERDPKNGYKLFCDREQHFTVNTFDNLLSFLEKFPQGASAAVWSAF